MYNILIIILSSVIFNNHSNLYPLFLIKGENWICHFNSKKREGEKSMGTHNLEVFCLMKSQPITDKNVTWSLSCHHSQVTFAYYIRHFIKNFSICPRFKKRLSICSMSCLSIFDKIPFAQLHGTPALALSLSRPFLSYPSSQTPYPILFLSIFLGHDLPKQEIKVYNTTSIIEFYDIFP